jgi:parallel beta-helix repeat protein
MYKRVTLTFFLVLCLVFVTLPCIEAVEASGTVYIRSDGTVEGTDKIQCDGNVYTFTDDIYGSLIVEMDDVVVDGAGHSIEGQHNNQAQSPEGNGIIVESQSKVTIRDVTVRYFMYGVCINRSSETHITESRITSNSRGIVIEHSSDSIIRECQITSNYDVGVYVFKSSSTNIQNNTVQNNINDGIRLILSSGDSIDAIDSCAIRENGVGIWVMNCSVPHIICQSNITNNSVGIFLETPSSCIEFNNVANNGVGVQIAGSDNDITHNNFVSNTKQVYDVAWDNSELSPSVNSWYEGDTGNYWSDYDGNGETPYVIYENNQDNFPVMEPFTIPYDPKIPDTDVFTISNIVWFIILLGIAAVLVVYFVAANPFGKTKE